MNEDVLLEAITKHWDLLRNILTTTIFLAGGAASTGFKGARATEAFGRCLDGMGEAS